MRAWILGEFSSPAALLGAVGRLRELGHRDLDAHTPYPVHGTSEALGLPRSRVPLYVLLGGLFGAALGYWMQWYCNAFDFPLNVGGRPPHSAPSFVPITFELGVLLAAFSAFFGALALMGLPRLHHPVFEAEGFGSASVDRFWVSVPFGGPEAERQELVRQLERLGAAKIATVEERA